MNERIKELSSQARAHAREYVADCKQYGYYMEHNEYDLQFEAKFAELLIRECGRVADVFCHIWCDEDKPHDVTVGNYIKRHVLRADPE